MLCPKVCHFDSVDKGGADGITTDCIDPLLLLRRKFSVLNRQNAEFSDSRVKGVARALRIAVRAAYKVTLAGRHY